MTNAHGAIPSSFRDPSGFVFLRDGELYRQVNPCYQELFDLLMGSGLYHELTSSGLLVEHREVSLPPEEREGCYKIIKPEAVPFLSFPYEWCFSQFKAAALATLRIQEKALEHGMVLKDASAYNIQFRDGRPVFIDTLSFERYREGEPWIAYRQFCQHFLAPLALMAATDVRLGLLLRNFIDGVPLDLASKLLPARSRLKLGLLMHIHLHAKSQERYGDVHRDGERTAGKETVSGKVSRQAMRGLIDSLKSTVKSLEWNPKGTEWGDYYSDTNYSDEAMQHKMSLVAEFVDKAAPKTVWDLGGNTGVFSRIASQRGIDTVSFDIDPAAVEKNYRRLVEQKEQNLLPLVLDLTNPSPAIGWQNQERDALLSRGPADAVLALALIHHLAISNNVPLPKIAEFFSKTCSSLIIEFVPKSDSQVRRLLASREDIFPQYTKEGFEQAFGLYFTQAAAHPVSGSERTLYLMQKKQQ